MQYNMDLVLDETLRSFLFRFLLFAGNGKATLVETVKKRRRKWQRNDKETVRYDMETFWETVKKR